MATEPRAGVTGDERRSETDSEALRPVNRSRELEDVSADPFSDTLPVKESDADLAKAIDAGVNQLLGRETDTVPQREAEELVRADLWIMERIQDPDARFAAASSLAEAAEVQSVYRAELEKQSPAVAKEVADAAAENIRRSEAKEVRKNEDFLALEEDRKARAKAWTDEQAKFNAAQDIGALREKAIHDPFDVDYHRKDMERNADANPVYRAEVAQLLEAEKDYSKVNSLEPSIEREQQPLSGADDEKRSAWLSKAKAAEPEVSTSSAAGANQVKSDEIFTAGLAEVKLPVPNEVEQQYKRIGDKFYSRADGDLVIEDKGSRLETKSNSEDVAESMVRIALARGWDEIKVEGTETFRKEVWLEAAERGMHVKGYTPTEQDKAELAQKTKGTAVAKDAATRESESFRARETALHSPEPKSEGIAKGDANEAAEAVVSARIRQKIARTALQSPDSNSQLVAKSYANETAEEAVRKHPELVGAVAAAAAIEKRAQADGLSPEQQAVVNARVRQNIVNAIEAGNIPKPVEIKEEIERRVEPENHREVQR